MGNCKIEVCDRDSHALSFCKKHYRAFKKYGDPLGTRSLNSDKVCSVEWCHAKVRCKMLCNIHYSRSLSGLSMDYRHKKVCTIDECYNYVHGNGLCNLHWQRQARWGNPFGYNTECVSCDKSMLVIRFKKYCEACKVLVRRMQKADAQLARQRSLAKPDYDRITVFNEDNWTCYLCTFPVSRFASNRLESASIDHIIPVSKGGKNTRDNVRLAHLICNIKKNDRLLSTKDLFNAN